MKNKVMEVLKSIQDPRFKRDLVSLGTVKELVVKGGNAFVHLDVPSESDSIRDVLKEKIEGAVSALEGIESVRVHISNSIQKNPNTFPPLPIPGVQNIIAVASGKGGVGKSTVSVNLALAISALGKKVGLMDGDIYGPNIPIMLGVSPDAKPLINEENKLVPLSILGIRMISMGLLVSPDQPLIWRGPTLHQAIHQFLQKVEWGELEYLLVDLPPGTGDVPLSLLQSVPLTGAVMVTTPQEVALLDVRKSIMMFRKTNVPVLGIIENMSGEVFGDGGGLKAAESLGVPFLGKVPLDPRIRCGGDEGKPIIVSAPDSEPSFNLRKAASQLIDAVVTV